MTDRTTIFIEGMRFVLDHYERYERGDFAHDSGITEVDPEEWGRQILIYPHDRTNTLRGSRAHFFARCRAWERAAEERGFTYKPIDE